MERIEVWMEENDDLAVITRDGNFAGVLAQDEKYVRAHADRLHEAMIAVMKVPDHKSGLWVWKISYGWTQIRGHLVKQRRQ